ncbi:MAG: cytochrome c [Bacteroidota bacterium]
MKKRLVFLLLPAFAILQFCSPSRKASAPVVASNFEQHIKPLVTTSCSPCHTTGNKSKLLEFAVAKEEADDIIRRINLTPADKGFMPFKHPKLSDSAIAVFVKWKADGLLEKAMP